MDSAVLSADHYFLDAEGRYVFNAKELGKAHAQCYKYFEMALVDDTSLVIVDNTNIRLKDIQKYIMCAKKYGYSIAIVQVMEADVTTCHSRNQHGVPRETIQRMKDNYEQTPTLS